MQQDTRHRNAVVCADVNAVVIISVCGGGKSMERKSIIGEEVEASTGRILEWGKGRSRKQWGHLIC